ncbi:prepilin peptidase [Candidatus Micrarchaeota archaeon]|nr:prepilin peptidase [Candidatus Micrarchaeota archaeon]
MLFDALPFDAWIRVFVAVLVTAVLAWQDHKTSFMDERVLYAFLATGLLWNVFFLPFSQMWPPVLAAALIGIVGYFSYRAGQFGGGDVLLLSGLALWLPVSPFVRTPVFWPFVLSVFLAASLLASAGSALWYADLLRQRGKFPGKKAALFLTGFAAVVALSLLLPFGMSGQAFIMLFGIPAAFYLIYRQDVVDYAVVAPQTLGQLLDEDVLALEKLDKKDVTRFGLERVLTIPAMGKLKNFMSAKKRKTVPVYRHLPRFGPYLLAGLLFSLAFGDLVWALVAG